MSLALPREKYWAGGLAAFVHLLLFTVLIFSVSWKHLPDSPVYAELWSDVPARTASPPSRPPPPKPKPAKPRVEPPPPKKAVAKPDIALEAARKREAQKKVEEEKRERLAEEMKKAEQDRLAQEAKQAQERAAEQKQAAQEAARKKLDAMLAAQMSQELSQERQAVQQQAATSARSKVIDDYIGRIRQKIRGLIRLPSGLKGNPEVVFKVDLLPNGDVVRVTQVKSSAQAAYDQEVERAIWKASPLPLPADSAAAAVFRSGLELRFRPHES